MNKIWGMYSYHYLNILKSINARERGANFQGLMKSNFIYGVISIIKKLYAFNCNDPCCSLPLNFPLYRCMTGDVPALCLIIENSAYFTRIPILGYFPMIK